MTKEIEIHHPKRLLENCIKSIKENKEFSKQNKKLLLSFQENCITRGLSFFRANKYLYLMKTITKTINKDLNKATVKDIESFVNWLEKSDYQEATKKDYKVCLKVFFKWIKKPELTEWVVCKAKRNKGKLPGELLTEEDILKLIDVTSHIRNKCLISVLFESGARISEIGSLKLKHVSFDEFGSTILVKGKSGSRRIRLIASTKYLSDWINQHPTKNNQDTGLWIGFKSKKPLQYRMFFKVLKEAGKKAEIQKKLNPHNFRHSRASMLAKVLTESQLKQFFGWEQSSTMPQIYVHLSGRDLDDSLLSMYGLKQKTQEEKSKLLPIKCPSCNELNTAGSVVCNSCQRPLTIEYALKQDQETKTKYELKVKELETKMILFEEYINFKRKSNTDNNTGINRINQKNKPK